MTAISPYVAGQWWVSHDNRTISVRSPFNNSLIGLVSVPDTAAIEQAVSSAVSGTRELASLPQRDRQIALRSIQQGLIDSRVGLEDLLVNEAGKPRAAARREVDRAIHVFGLAADLLSTWKEIRESLRSPAGDAMGVGIVKRVPRGPILAITPANSPLNLVAHKVAPALAVGAAVVVKPHERTPIIALSLARIIDDSTSLPDGSLSVLPLTPKESRHLVEDQRLRVLSFTGSQVGWILKQADPTRHCVLEMGGTASVIVTEDFEPTEAARLIANGAFDSSGQSCISTQHALVHHDIYDEVRRALLEEVHNYQPGDPDSESTRLRALPPGDLSRLEQAVKSAIASGARVLSGGATDPPFLAATILENTPVLSDIWSKEVFGPILSLRAFQSIDEAFELVNASNFGIHVGLLTHQQDVVARAIAELQVTGVVVGRSSDFRDDALPYGGTKMSGHGREGVASSMLEFTETRTLLMPEDVA